MINILLMNRVILIQGPSLLVEQQKESWEGFDIIWSIWDYEKDLYNSNDILVLNHMPVEVGTQNIGLQKTTTINGVNKAMSLKYDRILKWRSDQIPNNPKELMKLFDLGCINFLGWHKGNGGYFVD